MSSLTDIDQNTKQKLQQIHPRQWLNDTINIPIWRIKYSYTTVRNNYREYYKYLITDETNFDIVESEFKFWLEDFNKNNPKRKLSNVQILDVEFMGDFQLEIH